MSKIITCEQVSNGHPDKICDQIADAIVTDILQHDRNARVAIECLLKKSQLFIAGEVTTDYRPNYQQIVHDVFNRIGTEKLGWNLTELLRIGILVDKQSPDIAMGVDKGGAGDQGIMYGYATNETAEQMPIPYMVATKFLQLLKNHPSKMFRADAKAQVSYDYDTGRITTFLCSVQHSPDVEVGDFRHIIESMMVLAACEYGLDGDFTKLVNPTGRFVLGGSYADCGVTGRKSPDPPFICFLYPKAENFGADNLVYHHFNRLDIEVYTDYKDPDMEASIEEVLTAHELYYEKSEVWIETEKMYEVLYELTV